MLNGGLGVGGLLRNLGRRGQLRTVPTAAQSLNQLHRRGHLLHLEIGETLLLESTSFRGHDIDIGIDARS